MTPNCGIYGWYCTASDKWYVGQSIDMSNRRAGHLTRIAQGTHANCHLQSAFKKYGQDRMEFNILDTVGEDELDRAECWWIDYFDSNDRKFGYNIREGGGRLGHSEETKQKMAEAAKNPSDSKRAKLSAARRSNPELMHHITMLGRSKKGTVYSSEVRKRMSDGHRNRKPVSDETRRRMSSAHKGRVFSVESRRKISQSKLGKARDAGTRQKMAAAFKGKHHSQEVRLRISEKLKGIVHSQESVNKQKETCRLNRKAKLLINSTL